MILSRDHVRAAYQRALAALTILALLTLAGCTGSAEQSSAAGDFTVERLFTHDGCTVYRFRDGGVLRYFVRCSDGSSRTEWQESCGKGCSRNVEVPGGLL